MNIDKIAWIRLEEGRILSTRSRGKEVYYLPGGKRELDQRVFSSNAGDRDAAAFRIRRAARHFGTDRIGTMIHFEQRPRAGAVLRFGKRIAQRSSEGNAHRGVGFPFPGRGEDGEIGATLRRGGADLRCGIAGQQTREFVRIRRDLCNAEDPLRGIGVFVQGRTRKGIGDHVLIRFRISCADARGCAEIQRMADFRCGKRDGNKKPRRLRH